MLAGEYCHALCTTHEQRFQMRYIFVVLYVLSLSMHHHAFSSRQDSAKMCTVPVWITTQTMDKKEMKKYFWHTYPDLAPAPAQPWHLATAYLYSHSFIKLTAHMFT